MTWEIAVGIFAIVSFAAVVIRCALSANGASDAYQNGDKVSHADKRWISTTDNNVGEPGVYGWDEVTE